MGRFARTLEESEALMIEAMRAALSAVTVQDASGFLRHGGYRTAARLL